MTPTPEQEKIYNFIQYDANHGIIDAVAGSGKTTTIIESIQFVDKGKEMLFCAFNKSIRDEIHKEITEKGFDNIVVKNLHQLGFDILKSNSEVEYNVDPKKYDKIISKSINSSLEDSLKKYLKLYGINIEPQNSFEESVLKNNINSFKNKLTECVNKIRLTLTKSAFQEFKEMTIHFGIIDVLKTHESILDKVITILLNCTTEVLEIGNIYAKKQNLIDLTDMLYLPKCFELYPKKKYDLLFVDEWTDPAQATRATPFAQRYIDLIPGMQEESIARAPLKNKGCLDDWNSTCRTVINYENHIYYLWQLERPVDLVDRRCTICHNRTDIDGLVQVPAGQLELISAPSVDNQMTSYRELLFASAALDLVEGSLTPRVVDTGECNVDINGVEIRDENGICTDPVLTTVQVQASMSGNGARASNRFFNRFSIFDPVNQTVDHRGFLNPSELKLLREWLDLGGRYYQNPFDSADPIQD